MPPQADRVVHDGTVRRQSLNGKGEEEGLEGKGVNGRGKGKEERKTEKVKKKTTQGKQWPVENADVLSINKIWHHLISCLP